MEIKGSIHLKIVYQIYRQGFNYKYTSSSQTTNTTTNTITQNLYLIANTNTNVIEPKSGSHLRIKDVLN